MDGDNATHKVMESTVTYSLGLRLSKLIVYNVSIAYLV